MPRDEIVFDLMNSGNKEIAIISHKIVSPTTKKVLDDFVSKYPSTKIYSYEQFDDSIRNAAWKKCYGSEAFPAIKWNEAEIILSLMEISSENQIIKLKMQDYFLKAEM
jgi:hypothetical protein